MEKQTSHWPSHSSGNEWQRTQLFTKQYLIFNIPFQCCPYIGLYRYLKEIAPALEAHIVHAQVAQAFQSRGMLAESETENHRLREWKKEIPMVSSIKWKRTFSIVQIFSLFISRSLSVASHWMQCYESAWNNANIFAQRNQHTWRCVQIVKQVSLSLSLVRSVFNTNLAIFATSKMFSVGNDNGVNNSQRL